MSPCGRPLGLEPPLLQPTARSACCTAMASHHVLAFDHEGRQIQFDTWLDDLQLYLLSDSRDSVSLFDHTSGAAPAPPANWDSKCDLLTHRTAQALYDAVVARYSSFATAALGRLLLPYLFPGLSAFATVEDLVSHLRTSDARYRTRVARVVGVAARLVVGAAMEVVEAVKVVAAVGVVAGVGTLVAMVEAAVGVAVVAATCGKPHTQHRCFSRLEDAWRAEFGDEVERPHWAELLRSGVAIFDLDYDAILSAMYALSASAEGECYLCVPPDPGIEAAALGASESSLPVTAPAEALHTFPLGSGASCCFFHDSTTLTPLPAPVPVRLADLSGGPVVARSSTVLPCPAVPSGSLSGLHLPSFTTNLVSTAALQDAMVTTTTPGGSSLYTLATEPPQVAASAQVYASGEVAPPCSCRLLSHQTLLRHHRLNHPSLARLRGMHSRLLVSGLPPSLPPLPPSPAPPCLPCVEGRQRAAPHSSLFPLTIAPLQTLHMDVPSPALKRFRQDLPVLRLHSDRGGEFSSDLLRDFCHGEGILQSFMLPESPQQNGIAERRIGLVMEVVRTSMIHAAAPHFLCLFEVRYTAHQLNLWPRVSLPETSPTLRWTGKVGDASVFRVWGSCAFVRDTSADKLFARGTPCVFLGFSLDAPGWQFYHPTSRRVFPSQDVTFDKSVSFYCLFPYCSVPPPPLPLFLAPGPPPVDPLPPQGPAPSGVSQVDPLPSTAPVEVVVGSGAARGAVSGGAESEGAGSGGDEPGGVGSEGAKPGGAEPAGQLREWLVRRARLQSGATRAGGTGVAGAGGAGITTGASGTGVTTAAGPGGSRTRGVGAARTGGVGGTGCAEAGGAGDPTEPGAAGAGGNAARGTGAGGAVAFDPGTGGAGDTTEPGAAGAGGAGAVGAGAGGTAAGGARAVGTGAGCTGAGGAGARGAGAIDPGAGGTVQLRTYFVPLLQRVLGVPSSAGLPPPLLCPPPDLLQPPLQPASPLPAPSPYTEQSSGLTESKEMQDYLSKKGIEHHVSLPYAHQQQGVAERTNRTLMTKVRALMKQSKLLPTYWTYAMHHAKRVHNLLSTTSITSNSSPHVKWTETKGNTSMLRVHEHKAWLILDLMSKKIKNARDIIFYEWQFREDEQANANCVYANDGYSYASPEDEAAVAILEEDPRGEFTRGDRRDDDDDSPGAGGDGSGSGTGAAPPAPPEPESDDEDVQEVIPQHRHDSTVSGLQLLRLHTATSTAPRVIEPKNSRQALTGLHSKEWREAMDAEIKALESRDTWAPRLWQQYVHNILLKIGFKQLPHDPGMYRRDFRGKYILLTFEKSLAGRVDFTCNHDVKQFLGRKISYSPEAIHLSAAKYAEELGKHFNIAPAPLSTPYRTPGPNHKPDNKALPDLSYIASQLAQYYRKPTAENLLDLQRALQFFISTPNVGLCYSTIPTSSFNLIGYVDADHAADPDNRLFRTGFLFRLEPSGPISWNSQKQELVALSSAEAEFIATTGVVRKGLYLQELL
ncbi:unnamed protein product [Closterium sp. NIES-53]